MYVNVGIRIPYVDPMNPPTSSYGMGFPIFERSWMQPCEKERLTPQPPRFGTPETSSAESGWISPPWVPSHPNKQDLRKILRNRYTSHRKWLFDQTSTLNLLCGVPGLHYTIHNITLSRDPKRKKHPWPQGPKRSKQHQWLGSSKGKIGPGGELFSWTLLFDFITFGSKQPGKQKEDTVQDSFVFFHGSPVNGCNKNLKTFVLMCPLRIIGPSKLASFWGPYPCYTGSNPSIGGSKILRVERQNEGILLRNEVRSLGFCGLGLSIWRISLQIQNPRQFFINQNDDFAQQKHEPPLESGYFGDTGSIQCSISGRFFPHPKSLPFFSLEFASIVWRTSESVRYESGNPWNANKKWLLRKTIWVLESVDKFFLFFSILVPRTKHLFFFSE